MDAIKVATDPSLMARINSFQKATPQDPFNFEMVSEAEGVKYSVFRTQVRHFEVRQPFEEAKE